MSARTPVRATRRSTRSPAPTSTASIHPAKGTTPKTASKSHKRPPLPLSEFNPLLANVGTAPKGKSHTVKTQELTLRNNDTCLIARVKCPTPKGISGHLIKRFDTDAVSASSFFRVAFPSATQQAEDAEMNYLRKIYKAVEAGQEHLGEDLRLTGTWIPSADGAALATEYGIVRYATDLIVFENPYVQPNQDTEPAVPTPTKKAKSTSPEKATSPEPSTRSKRARVLSPRLAAAAAAAADSMGPSPSILDLVQHATEPTGEMEIEDASLKVTVTSISHDPLTGEAKETQAVASLIGTDEQVEKAREEAKAMMASLKATGEGVTLLEGGRKRGLEGEKEDEDDEEQNQTGNGSTLSRRWWRRREAKAAATGQAATKASDERAVAKIPSDRVAPSTRRNIAIVSMVVAGAAASIAPYFF